MTHSIAEDCLTANGTVQVPILSFHCSLCERTLGTKADVTLKKNSVWFRQDTTTAVLRKDYKNMVPVLIFKARQMATEKQVFFPSPEPHPLHFQLQDPAPAC